MNLQTLIYLFFFVVCTPFVQGMSLEDFNNRFEEELAKIVSKHETEDKSLEIKYLSALLRLESTSRTQGNLELVQATRKEVSRIEQGQDLKNDGSPVPPELEQMRQLITKLKLTHKQEAAASTVTLTDNLKSYATNRSIEATRQGMISEAVSWKEWGENLDENEQVSSAYSFLRKRPDQSTISQKNQVADVHEALEGRPVDIQVDKAKRFSDRPKVYVQGSEPKGNEKRIQSSTPSMQGAGNTLLTGNVILIEEKDINKSGYYGTLKEKSLTYIPRLSISPIIGKSLDRSLVVFDLYKRGTGSKRSVIRTDTVLLPPLTSDEVIVIDAGIYAYETEEYDSRWSSFDYKTSTDDEFYGYIVTIFDRNGEMIYQRATERGLKDYARETPPR
jgi:hypothetical protein